MVPHLLFGFVFDLQDGDGIRASVPGYMLAAWECTEIAAWGVLKAAITLAVLQALNGNDVLMRMSVARGAPYLLPAIAIECFVFLPYLLINTTLGYDDFLIFIETTFPEMFWLLLVISLLAIGSAWICAVMVSVVAVPALVVERGGIWASLRRSYRLARGNRWRVVTILVCVGLSMMLLQFVQSIFLSDTASLAWKEVLHVVNHASLAMVSAILSIVLYQTLRALQEEGDTNRVAAVFD